MREAEADVFPRCSIKTLPLHASDSSPIAESGAIYNGAELHIAPQSCQWNEMFIEKQAMCRFSCTETFIAPSPWRQSRINLLRPVSRFSISFVKERPPSPPDDARLTNRPLLPNSAGAPDSGAAQFPSSKAGNIIL